MELLQGPSPEILSLPTREYLQYRDPRGAAVRDESYAVFIELLNCPVQFRGREVFSDVNSRRTENARLILSDCIFDSRAAMTAEVLKRGASPNLQEFSFKGTYSYPTLHVICATKRWAIRLLVLQGGNFNLRGNGGHVPGLSFAGKTAREAASTEKAIQLFCGYRPWYTQEIRRQYGPLEGGKLLSQQLDFLYREGLTLFDYLEQVEREVADMKSLKDQGDTYWKRNDFLNAGIFYERAGQAMEEFAYDHEQLIFYYLSMAVFYYGRAMESYELFFKIEKNDASKSYLLAFLNKQLTHIEAVLKPAPMPLPAYEGEKREPFILEEIKRIKDSAVMRDILQYQQKLLDKRNEILRPVGHAPIPSPLVQRLRAQTPTSVSSEEDNPRQPLLPHEKTE